MNKKAEIAENVFNNLIYIVIVLITFSLAYASLSMYKNGTAVWQEYYADEVRKAVELAEPGDMIVLDVQQAVAIAGRNKFSDREKMFSFNDATHEVCAQFDHRGRTCVYYFNNIKVENIQVDVKGDVAKLYINLKKV